MGEKTIKYPVFSIQDEIDTEKAIEKAYELSHILEREGFGKSNEKVEFISGRKVFSITHSWKKRTWINEKAIDVKITGWEGINHGRLRIEADGKIIQRIDYKGFFESLAADLIAEKAMPGKLWKKKELEKILKAFRKGQRI